MPALSSFTAAFADELELLNKLKTCHSVERSAILKAHQRTVELQRLSIAELDGLSVAGEAWFSEWVSQNGWVVG
jgi:hypothetical protein